MTHMTLMTLSLPQSAKSEIASLPSLASLGGAYEVLPLMSMEAGSHV